MPDPAPLLSLEQAVTMRDACRYLPEHVAFTASSMLFLLESYIRLLRERDRDRELWDGLYGWPKADA